MTWTWQPGWVRLEGRRYRLIDELTWAVGHRDSGLLVSIPEGFLFDVSVPRPLQWIVSPSDIRHLKASALHDWMLSEGWPRMTATAEMYSALAADGVPRWRRVLMWIGVTGWDAWIILTCA